MHGEHETTRHRGARNPNASTRHRPEVRTRFSRRARAAALALLATVPAADACSPRKPTPEGYLGPHDFTTAPASNELWREGDRGEQLVLSLRVLDTCGKPLPGARVHLLHADATGEHALGRYRAILKTDAKGAVNVLTAVPGYAGDLARHIHFIISHPGHAELVTRLYLKNDPRLEGRANDPLALVLEEVRHGQVKRWVSGYEFVLRPARK